MWRRNFAGRRSHKTPPAPAASTSRRMPPRPPGGTHKPPAPDPGSARSATPPAPGESPDLPVNRRDYRVPGCSCRPFRPPRQSNREFAAKTPEHQPARTPGGLPSRFPSAGAPEPHRQPRTAIARTRHHFRRAVDRRYLPRLRWRRSPRLLHPGRHDEPLWRLVPPPRRIRPPRGSALLPHPVHRLRPQPAALPHRLLRHSLRQPDAALYPLPETLRLARSRRPRLPARRLPRPSRRPLLQHRRRLRPPLLPVLLRRAGPLHSGPRTRRAVADSRARALPLRARRQGDGRHPPALPRPLRPDLLPARLWPFALLTAAFILYKTTGPARMTTNAAYLPSFSWQVLAANWRHYAYDLFYGAIQFTSLRIVLLWAVVLALVIVLRKRDLLFAACVILLGILPVVLIAERGFYAIYLTLPGWYLLAARSLTTARHRLLPRAGAAAPAILFLLVAACLVPLHLRQKPRGNGWVAEAHESVRCTLQPLRYYDVPRAAKVLVLNDPYPDGDNILLAMFRLSFRDEDIQVRHLKSPSAPPPGEVYDRVFTYAHQQLTLLPSAR